MECRMNSVNTRSIIRPYVELARGHRESEWDNYHLADERGS